MQKINILGTAITDYSLKESLVLVEEYVRSGVLNTILYITTPTLILAGKDEEEKRLIEAMDMTLCGDTDILRVAKIDAMGRLYEVENFVFLKEFLRRVVRSNKQVYLLAESEEELRKLGRELEMFHKGIVVGGSSIIEEAAEDKEEIINRINDIAPLAVISRLPSGRQEKWMLESKLLINAEVWLGIAKDIELDRTEKSVYKKLRDKFYRKMFYRRISRFKDNEEKNNQAGLK